MASDYNNYNYSPKDASRDADDPNSTSEIGYPVHVYFIELSKMHMHQVPWQWHPEIEILIVNHGEINFLTSDKKETITAGQGVIINANVMHAIESSSKDANCSMYSTVFHPAFLFGYGDVLMSNKYLNPVVSSKNFQYMLLDEEKEKESYLLDCVNGVIADNLIKKNGYELTTKSKLCDFWVALLEEVAPYQQPKRVQSSISLDESRSKDMILYIEQNYAEKITLDDLAGAVHISKSECCRCFKRALDLTPIEYLMKYRISMAASFIQNRDSRASSFSDLAFNVGFNNASYFNKVFREYMGCTPSEYRRKIKADPNFDPFKNIML